jgi:hypothetical protein
LLPGFDLEPLKGRAVFVVCGDVGLDMGNEALWHCKSWPLAEIARLEWKDQTSIWLSQEAWVGVKWKCRQGYFCQKPGSVMRWVLRLSKMMWNSFSGWAGLQLRDEIQEFLVPLA